MNENTMHNPYKPISLCIHDIRDETSDVRTLTLKQMEGKTNGEIRVWKPGQFGEFTVYGVGECVFAIANDCVEEGPVLTRDALVQCTFRAVGKVTNALRALSPGQCMGFRGPYGNHFPVDVWKGKHLAFLGGGIGMAALRATLIYIQKHRQDYGDVLLINGARSVGELVYSTETEDWEHADFQVIQTVDPGGETPDWNGQVGFVPAVFEPLELSPENRIVVACGPPVMIHAVFKTLDGLGYQGDQVITTLENKMKCGFGHCGRCNVGEFFVCRDGPVVTWEQMKSLPNDF